MLFSTLLNTFGTLVLPGMSKKSGRPHPVKENEFLFFFNVYMDAKNQKGPSIVDKYWDIAHQ